MERVALLFEALQRTVKLVLGVTTPFSVFEKAGRCFSPRTTASVGLGPHAPHKN